MTSWTVACQAPLSMGFSGQEYWSGLPFPPPGDLPNPGIEPKFPALAGRFFATEPISDLEIKKLNRSQPSISPSFSLFLPLSHTHKIPQTYKGEKETHFF